MIVRHTFSSRIGKIIDVNGHPHEIIRPVYWEAAIKNDAHWAATMHPHKYFYYEVEPINVNTSTRSSSSQEIS